MLSTKIRVNLLVLGDILALYSSLVITLLSRYRIADFKDQWQNHLLPFSLIFIIWVLVFYLSNLYSFKYFRYDISTIQPFISAILISLLASIAVFYIWGPLFQVTPKSNLLIFTGIFLLIDYLIRLFLTRTFNFPQLQKRIMVLGDSPTLVEVDRQLKHQPEIGYRIIDWKKGIEEKEYQELLKKIKEEKIEILVISREVRTNQAILKMLYGILPFGIEVWDAEDLYEIIFQKIPIKDLEESWFIEKIKAGVKLYDNFKRIFDLFLASLVFFILLPVILLIAILIRTTSAGPMIYSQRRIGRKEKEFTLYKFRTMRKDAEAGGPQWAKDRDSRITPVGKILRHTHLDEIPQLINIIKGELSFVGPRPERPEFVSLLREKIPYYNIRHIVKPGLTGSAQINYRYGSSVEDAEKKLEFDIYYIKNRSFVLDVLIILKTIRLIFKNH